MITTANTRTTEAGTEASVLQMIRAEINVREYQRWMGVRRLQDPDHAMHCLLVECFGDLAPKPFRLIMPRGGSTGCLYGYARAASDTLRETAAICADPLQSRIIPAGKLDSKSMPAEWPTGKRLGFEVRIRPTRRLNRPAGNGERHTAERDAFLMQALDETQETRSREEVYQEWLSERLEKCGGASLDAEETKLVSFQRTRAYRKRHARHSEGPDAVMRGILTITDPDDFAALLARGVGRHRAYGFGMLLLRPARG